MSITINELKGFDFSNKYLNIKEKFSIITDGKKADFKIFKRETYRDSDEYENWIEIKYYDNNKLVKYSKPYQNPFAFFREVEKNIMKEDNSLNRKAILIKNTLEEFNQDFDKWAELTHELSSKVDILKLFPNYKSSKIPQNLSKKDLAIYLDNFSKFELETLFKEISMLDFEIFYQNTWGEDYEYLIEKAFTSNILGEKIFSRVIYEIINKKRNEFYISTILKNYGFNYEEYDLMVPIINSIVNSNFDRRNFIDIRSLRLQKLIKEEKIDLMDENVKLDKLEELRKKVYKETNKHHNTNKTNFNNLDDCLTKSKYVFVLKAISSKSKSQIVMRYKIPKDNRTEDSVQTIALNNGHIQLGNSKENLSEYTVDQLKNILKKYGFKVGGNKTDLINRIKDNLSDEIVNEEFPKKYFTITENGQEYLEKYYYLAEFYNVLPANFTLDEFDLICKSNSDINPDDIIQCLTKEKWIIWDETLGEEPKDKNYEKLMKILENRKREDNYYRNIYDSVILV